MANIFISPECHFHAMYIMLLNINVDFKPLCLAR